MTKSDLVEAVSSRARSVPRREVEAIVHAMFDTLIEALKRGERIEIRGFGSFAVKRRPAREGRNPKTGQKVSVPPRSSPHFTVGKELRERLNGGAPAQAMPPAAAAAR
jgi:integration host factor subunit beta